MSAAEELFAEHGFDAVSVETIAQKAAVSQSNIFYHFKTKRLLYLSVLRAIRERISSKLDPVTDEEMDLHDFLQSVSDAIMKLLYSDTVAIRFFMREFLGFGIVKREEMMEKVMGGSFRRIVIRLKEQVNTGHMRKEADPVITALILFAASVASVQPCEQLAAGKQQARTRAPNWYSKNVVEILLKGVVAD